MKTPLDLQQRRGAPRPAHTRARSARALVTVVVAVAALTLGAAVGYWVPAAMRGGDAVQDSGAAEVPAGDDEVYYTCGMHPDVIQKGPGDCPICHMKLTPMKAGAGESDERPVTAERKVLYWRAPMDPNYVSDKPGKSPMGMDLVPVYADEAASASADAVRIDPVTVQNMGIRTAALRRGPLVKTIRTVGRVDYDEQLVTFVDTKFSGWIESLHVNETGQFVQKADPLFDVYSPELFAAQEEYLAALRSLPLLEESRFTPAREEASKMIEAARTKLRYLDVPDEQITTLRETGAVQKTVAIHSPARGIVTEKMALEGMYVKPGMRLYTIADLSRIWVYVDVYEYQLPWLRIGQTARMTLPYSPGREFFGTVVYIYPYLERQTRVIKVRLEFDNPTLELKPGMFAQVRLESELGRDSLLIPRTAYIDSGVRKLTFVARGGGKFQPREIQTGVEAEDGMVEVLYGLDEGEVVVTSGQFLLDAESKLREAVAKMMEPDRAETQTSKSAPPKAEIMKDARYACPMDKHPAEKDPAKQGAYFSKEPGRCPWCGMDLKPIEELDWARAMRAGAGSEVAYTCPDHQHLFSANPGQCPRCNPPDGELQPFKVMYTCPDPAHAGVISTSPDDCPHCGRALTPYRGVWLADDMADENVPPIPGLAEVAPYRCPLHPLVHSDNPGSCTVCAAPLKATAEAAALPVPSDARFVCPMKECWHFSTEPGRCPECGMSTKPIEEVPWAADLRTAPVPETAGGYLCPMHPEKARAEKPGTCPICGMQLVEKGAFRRPQDAPTEVAAQMNYLMEHYLELQKLLAADRTQDVARQALAIASASDELTRHLADPAVKLPPEAHTAARDLHAAALKTSGADLAHDRVAFVKLSNAMRTLIEHARPDRTRWPRLYIYHCPMSKGDWIQGEKEKRNPYFGFQMLTCGELQDIK